MRKNTLSEEISSQGWRGYFHFETFFFHKKCRNILKQKKIDISSNLELRLIINIENIVFFSYREKPSKTHGRTDYKLVEKRWKDI